MFQASNANKTLVLCVECCVDAYALLVISVSMATSCCPALPKPADVLDRAFGNDFSGLLSRFQMQISAGDFAASCFSVHDAWRLFTLHGMLLCCFQALELSDDTRVIVIIYVFVHLCMYLCVVVWWLSFPSLRSRALTSAHQSSLPPSLHRQLRPPAALNPTPPPPPLLSSSLLSSFVDEIR